MFSETISYSDHFKLPLAFAVISQINCSETRSGFVQNIDVANGGISTVVTLRTIFAPSRTDNEDAKIQCIICCTGADKLRVVRLPTRG